MMKKKILAIIIIVLMFTLVCIGCFEKNNKTISNLSVEEKRFVGFWTNYTTKIEYNGSGSDKIPDNPYYDNISIMNLTFYSDRSWDFEAGPVGNWEVKDDKLVLNSEIGFWKSVFITLDEKNIEFNYSFSDDNNRLQLSYIIDASFYISDDTFSNIDIDVDDLNIIWYLCFSKK